MKQGQHKGVHKSHWYQQPNNDNKKRNVQGIQCNERQLREIKVCRNCPYHDCIYIPSKCPAVKAEKEKLWKTDVQAAAK
jgi:hypothetical protein